MKNFKEWQLFEGKMAEIDIMAKDSKDLDEFIEKFKNFNRSRDVSDDIDQSLKDWLEEIFKTSKEDI